MELQVGEYFIPDGCTIKKIGNTIRVYQKKKDKLDVKDYRCKDCIHYTDGHSGLYYWTTMVCDAKPKVLSSAMEKRRENHKDFQHFKLYFAAQKYGKPCNLFEARKKGE